MAREMTINAAAAQQLLLARASGATTLEFDRGHVVFDQGVRPDRVYQIVEGKVMIGRASDNGQSCLFQIMGPTDVFGEISALDGGPQPCRAIAMTSVSVVALSRDDFSALVIEDAAAAEYLLRVVARSIRRSSEHLADLMCASVAARVAKQILRLTQRFGKQYDGALHVELDLTQEQFAQLVGTCRESLNKTLSVFAGNGWIRLEGDHLVILDSEPLTACIDGAVGADAGLG